MMPPLQTLNECAPIRPPALRAPAHRRREGQGGRTGPRPTTGRFAMTMEAKRRAETPAKLASENEGTWGHASTARRGSAPAERSVSQ